LLSGTNSAAELRFVGEKKLKHAVFLLPEAGGARVFRLGSTPFYAPAAQK